MKMKKKKEKKTCPCCGYKTLTREEDGTCSICFWDDNLVQATDPNYEGGPNEVSLIQAQRNFREFGACEKDMIKNVRKPIGKDIKDKNFKPFVE